jgi:hypothetical protein
MDLSFLNMNDTTQKNRGGHRAGSGRKKLGRTQLVIRLKKEIVEALQPGAAAKVRQLVENNFKTL